MLGSLIQDTGRSEFEDGLRTGVQPVLKSGLQNAITILKVKDSRAFEASLDPSVV